ncbi:MAG: hypothetical protein LBT38_03415 [Deltaproteobacteria bacterium]|jgi:cell division protein FtsZ|nr:hypothetical protein [Deltaproteobacteria bacterium]
MSSSKRPVIKFFGLGGRGVSALNLIRDRGLRDSAGPIFPLLITANSDLQDLSSSKAQIKIQVGAKSLKGVGAGGMFEEGKKGLLEVLPEISSLLAISDLVILISGIAGGTGSTLSLVAKSLNARPEKPVLFAVTFSPFSWEDYREPLAQKALKDLRAQTPGVLDIPNAKVSEIYPELSTQAIKKKIDEAFYRAMGAIASVCEKADFLKILTKKGQTGLGYADVSGPDRALQALEAAIQHPLMGGFTLKEAKGAIICISCFPKVKESEQKAITRRVQELIGSSGDFVVGSVQDERLLDQNAVKVTILATGLSEAKKKS